MTRRRGGENAFNRVVLWFACVLVTVRAIRAVCASVLTTVRVTVPATGLTAVLC